MNNKKILIGEIIEDYYLTPVECFEKALELSDESSFTVYTNNPLFIESLEVLCGEDDIDVYIVLNEKTTEIDFSIAYDFTSDIYRILNTIRFVNDLGSLDVDKELLKSYIDDYKEKYYGDYG